MKLRERLFSTIVFRSMLTQFGNRSPYSVKRTAFIPYFQYKIGQYQNDYYLYFRKAPFLEVYKNEIFNKMYEYSGYDIVRYLEFHYEACSDKGEFQRFLQYEVAERLKHKVSHTYKLKLQSTLAWLAEKQGVNQADRDRALKAQIEHDVRSAFDGQAGPNFDIWSFPFFCPKMAIDKTGHPVARQRPLFLISRPLRSRATTKVHHEHSERILTIRKRLKTGQPLLFFYKVWKIKHLKDSLQKIRKKISVAAHHDHELSLFISP